MPFDLPELFHVFVDFFLDVANGSAGGLWIFRRKDQMSDYVARFL